MGSSFLGMQKQGIFAPLEKMNLNKETVLKQFLKCKVGDFYPIKDYFNSHKSNIMSQPQKYVVHLQRKLRQFWYFIRPILNFFILFSK